MEVKPKKIRQNVIRFLKKYGMDHLDVDMDATVNEFLSEMQEGLEGKKSTLDMIPTYIEVGAEVPTNKQVIVIDAGGTNFRVATVYFNDKKKPIIKNLHLSKMPGIERDVNKDEFFPKNLKVPRKMPISASRQIQAALGKNQPPFILLKISLIYLLLKEQIVTRFIAVCAPRFQGWLTRLKSRLNIKLMKEIKNYNHIIRYSFNFEVSKIDN